jgi:hypothetical protein
MDKLHSVAVFDLECFEIFSVDEAAVDLNYDRGIIFIGPVQQFLNGQFAPIRFLGEPVENYLQFRASAIPGIYAVRFSWENHERSPVLCQFRHTVAILTDAEPTRRHSEEEPANEKNLRIRVSASGSRYSISGSANCGGIRNRRCRYRSSECIGRLETKCILLDLLI